MQSDLSGQVAVVTGAAQGIGRAIADRLATCQASVVYADINETQAEEAAAAAPSDGGHFAMAMNVASEESVNEVIERVVSRSGRIDHLINNAGVNTLEHRVAIDQFPLDEWERLVSVNLTGLFLTSKRVSQEMKKQGSGRIVNITSVAGLVPLRLQCAFIAAKAGVVNLTKAMALELAPHGILVNAVAPGSIATPRTKTLFEEKYDSKMQRMLDHVGLQRQGTTDEIAVGVQFLLDPENTYMTGHVLTMDGGWTAGYTRDF